MVVAAILAGLLAVSPAHANAYTLDGPNYGWRSVDGGHEYSSPRGTFSVTGFRDTPSRAFSAAHRSAGGGRGALGYPTTRQIPERNEVYLAEGYVFDVDGAYQVFERGVVYGSRTVDNQGFFDLSTTAVVRGGQSPFRAVHDSTGGGSGSLSYPIGDEVRQAGNYWYQVFLLGVIYVSPSGAYPVYDNWGGFNYTARGGGSGPLGYPTARHVQQGSHYAYQTFERGILYAVPPCYECDASPIGIEVRGGFIDAHAARGGGTGSLGYPRWNETYNSSTRTWTQIFERGRIEIGPGGTRYVMGKFWG
ncbi:LGFP repeat-containing protein [Litorihabitans aurantiacus]|nr:hypothetical protein [Litorihabitans aurantiacus]